MPSHVSAGPHVVVFVADDPDDDHVIAAAVESGATYLVSEDRHLLRIGRYAGIQILSRAEFSVELDRLGIPQ